LRTRSESFALDNPFISELAVEQARLIVLARRKPSLYAESRQLEEERITDDLRKKRFIRTR
jgi:hypothetical protein